MYSGAHIIDLSNGSCDHVEILVTFEDGAGTTSVVQIGSAAKDESRMLNAIVGLGKVVLVTCH